MKKRIVITGMGALTPIGNNVADTWDNILKGKSGIDTIGAPGTTCDFDISDLTTRIAGQVKNFDSSLALLPKEARRMDIFIHYAVEAARQALEDAKLTITDQMAPRAGIAIGSGIGGLPWLSKYSILEANEGPRKISPFFIPGCIINMTAGFVSMKYNFRGPNISIVTACTTGVHNIGHAARMIAYGDADIMLAGGAEMATSKVGVGGFAAARALSTRNDDPQKASRPWDKDRDGFILGEGAGVVVLEELEAAKKRGAPIYAEVVGFGMSGDAYHMTSPAPDGRGFISCMQNAINDADLSASDIQYVNAHGTSTVMGDILEANAIKDVFGEHASNIAVSSTKSMTGHLLGAAGSVEAIFAALALRDNIAPPTINLDNPDEGCDLNFVPNKPQKMEINVALSNSFGFGGTNGSLVLKKFEG